MSGEETVRNGENEICLGEWLIVKGEMPPFTTVRVKSVTKHYIPEYHPVIVLFLIYWFIFSGRFSRLQVGV